MAATASGEWKSKQRFASNHVAVKSKPLLWGVRVKIRGLEIKRGERSNELVLCT